MNKQDTIRQFCKINIKFLTDQGFDKHIYKQKIRAWFYEQHKNRYGQPSPKEIQFSLVELLRQNGIASDEIVKIVKTAPFFEEISDQTLEEIALKLSSKTFEGGIAQEHIETIKQVGAYKTLEKTKGDEIELKKQSTLIELDKQIEAKKQEYEALPSLLDQSMITEPEYNPKAEDVKPWWERFYLKSDPFPRKDGLSAINADLYEAVTTKTKPFIDTISALNRNKDYLFHGGFLLVGDYGYGKTTFIDYLSHYLINANVLPVRITCTRCSADVSGFADSFFHRLRKELQDEAKKIAHVDDSTLIDLEIEDQVIELIKTIIKRKAGIVVFLDDYHKHATHFKQIFEFIGTLQVLKDTLTRKELPVGFIVSGLSSWRYELRQNSQMSGFLDNPVIEMPDVGVDLVCSVFNNRIKAYCYEGTPRLIKVDFVEKLVKEFAGKAGFRDYITKIVEELSHNNYAIVDSPIEIAQEKLTDIKELLESDATLKSGITKLVYGSLFKRFSQEQIAKTLELLVHVGTQGGITETDREFISNQFYFQTLKECGLIQKQRHGSRDFSWGLSSRLRKSIELVQHKHGLSLHDYLLKIYAFKGYGLSSRVNGSVDSQLEVIKKFFYKKEIEVEPAILDHIELGIRLFETYVGADASKRKDANDLKRAYDGAVAFSNALFILDTSSLYFSRANIDSIELQWQKHPFANEAISEAFIRYHDYLKDKTHHKLALALKQNREALGLIADLVIEVLSEQSSVDLPLLHRPPAHAVEEVEIFEIVKKAKYSSIGEDHFDYVRRVTDWLELRMRSFFFLTGNLLFGQNYLEQAPKGVVNYAYKNLETRVDFTGVENHFDGLTRSQYRLLLTEGNAYRDLIIKELGLAWKEADWDLFASIFAEMNIDASHQKISAYSPGDRVKYLRYCSMAEEFLAAINFAVSRILDNSIYFLKASPNSKAPNEVFIKYNFKKGLKIKDTDGRIFDKWPKTLDSNAVIKDHVIDQLAYHRILNQLTDKVDHSPDGLLTLDLLDSAYILAHYRVSIAEMSNILGYASLVDNMLNVLPWFGSSMIIKKHK